MNLLNLFGSDSSDSIQSSRFAANLRKSTYDPLLITFNSIRTGKKKDTAIKDTKGPTTPTPSTPSTPSTQTIDILSQKMVLTSSFDSLDAAQRQTQRESTCDYVAFVPTSFEINKDVMNAFYDSKLKQLFKRKTEFDNAAANIFLNWSMFESFVMFANKQFNERQIALIEKSYESAKKEVDLLTNATKYAINFSATPHNVPIELNELWEIVYDMMPDRLKKTGLTLKRMLTYFYVYSNQIALFNRSSVGRIPNYLPLLNSNISMTTRATKVDFTGDEAAPSRNVERMTAFLMGIMTNKNLSNRSELRSDKLKAIRDKTYLCTFKSTTDDSLNYETLLKRLYYKFPCFLTPSLMVSREKITQMCDEVVDESIRQSFEFENVLEYAVSKIDAPTNACNLICAVAVATYAHIMINVDLHEPFDPGNIRRELGYIYRELNEGNTFSDAVNAINLVKLTPLLEPARAVANSIYEAAKHQTLISEKKSMKSNVINAMEQVIFDQYNFASFMYNNPTLLSLMKYSDQAPMHATAPDPKHADYLKTFYKSLANNASARLKDQDEFNQFNDEMLYIIHGPLYFDYEWIFRQDPSLIRHILGEELPAQDSTTSIKEQSQWIRRVDPLTENAHYINQNPPPNYPKMRFDNPTPLPNKTESRMDYSDPRYTRKTWKELYVSPEQARAENQLETMKEAIRNAATMTGAITALTPDFENWNKCTAGAKTAIDSANEDEVDAMYNWTTPGYYRYELTATQNLASTNEQLTYRFMQLMRPVEPGAIQDYTEPNLPTAYPPPLMFITPPMRGPTNSFILHTWIPDLSSEISPSYKKFMTAVGPNGKKSLNRGAYMEQLYKMMQLVFKTVILNVRSAGSTSASTASASSADTKRICVKIMAIGYDSDERNLKMVSKEDKKFIGDSFFYAVRDYSMFYEANNVNVIVYYDEKTQQDVKQRYNEYTSQRESVLLRTGASTSQATTIDETLKLKIMPADEFFTLKFQMGKLQLQEKDLLYFVNYCSTPRAFIGNCGECPTNIEDVVNEEIASLSSSSPSSSPLETCLREAQKSIETLYNARKIPEKMAVFANNLEQWNTRALPKQMVSFQEKIRDTYVNYKETRAVVNASEASKNPTNVNVSWWMTDKNAIPLNAYLSSFDEHVLILHNLLEPFKDAVDDFNASIYVYTQVKKILTLLSKIKPDNIQIRDDEITAVKSALADLTVNMEWSMDAKFATGVCDGAFIPNSSVLHNPFVCTQLLDINKWQYVDFDDIASREIPEAKPLPPLLKKIVDLKIQESQGVSSMTAESSAVAVNSGILMVSKQPSIARFMKNVKTIFENLFQKNAPLKIDGKEMVLNNYAWPEEQLYCKMRNDTKLASFKTGAGRKAIDFAELRGLRSSSAKKCIEFPLFVVQVTLTLFEGKLSDITLLDQASLTCSSDKAMMDSNLKIVWEQMMTNLKAKEQNFTIANVFKRLGFNSVDVEYDYTAYFDADPKAIGLLDATRNNGTATILIACTDVATNPILRTTNSQKLKTINEEVSDNALTENAKFYNTPPYDPNAQLPLIGFPYNSIRVLAQIAEYFNLAEMHGVAGIEIERAILTEMAQKLANFSNSNYQPQTVTNTGARIGWNAAIQIDSTMLYINPNVMVNGTLQDISSYLLGLKPGDKILIKTDTNAVQHGKDFIYAAGRIMKRSGLRLAKYMKIKLLNAIYSIMNGLTLLMSLVFRAIVLGGKSLLALFKFIVNCVKQTLMVGGVTAATMATGIPLAIGWVPLTAIVAILQGIITISIKIRNKFRKWRASKSGPAAADADAAADAADADDADDDDDDAAAVPPAAADDDDAASAAVPADDDDAASAAAESISDADIADMKASVEEIGGAESAGSASAEIGPEEQSEAVEATFDILNKYMKTSSKMAQAFLTLVKNGYKTSFKKIVEPGFRNLPTNVLTDARQTQIDYLNAPARWLQAKKDASNAEFVNEKQQYDDKTAEDQAIAITEFKRVFEKSQMWMITGSPARNPGLSTKVINIPVYHFRLRASNLTNPFGQQIDNNTKLKVEFQKFSKDD